MRKYYLLCFSGLLLLLNSVGCAPLTPPEAATPTAPPAAPTATIAATPTETTAVAPTTAPTPPPINTEAAAVPAERIEFDATGTAITRSGNLEAGGVKEYVLTATAGQSLHIQTVGYTAPVSFVLRSPGGTSWNGEMQPAGAYIFTVQITLPEDGDYVATLAVPPDATATNYDVIFTSVEAAD